MEIEIASLKHIKYCKIISAGIRKKSKIDSNLEFYSSNYVDPPSKKNLIKLVEGNFRIERISYKSNLIDVKFIGKTFKQKDFNSLAKVYENIQRLDFSGVNLSQISLNKLKSFENLNYLNLNNTSIR